MKNQSAKGGGRAGQTMSVKFYSMPKLKANQIIEEVEVTRERKKVQKEYGKTN